MKLLNIKTVEDEYSVSKTYTILGMPAHLNNKTANLLIDNIYFKYKDSESKDVINNAIDKLLKYGFVQHTVIFFEPEKKDIRIEHESNSNTICVVTYNENKTLDLMIAPEGMDSLVIKEILSNAKDLTYDGAPFTLEEYGFKLMYNFNTINLNIGGSIDYDPDSLYNCVTTQELTEQLHVHVEQYIMEAKKYIRDLNNLRKEIDNNYNEINYLRQSKEPGDFGLVKMTEKENEELIFTHNQMVKKYNSVIYMIMNYINEDVSLRKIEPIKVNNETYDEYYDELDSLPIKTIFSETKKTDNNTGFAVTL